MEMSIIAVFLFFSFISTLGSILSYFRFYFWLDDRHFNLHEGILRKNKLQIPFERIQAIKLEQNLFHQAFSLTALEVETAGSKGAELKIYALPMALAQEIRSYVFSKKEEMDISKEESVALKGIPKTSIQTEFDGGDLLFKLSTESLIKIGLSQNHLRTMGLVLIFTLVTFERITELYMRYAGEEALEEAYGLGNFLLNAMFLGVSFSVLLALALGYSIVQTLIRHADFMVYRTREGLRVIGGLFNRIEQVVVRRKIQLMVLDANPLKRLFGLKRVRFFQASSDLMSTKESIVIPGCDVVQEKKVIEEYISPDRLLNLKWHSVQPVYAVRYFLLTLLLPLLIVVAAGYFRFGIQALWLLWLIPVLGVLANLHYNMLKYAVDDDYLVLKKGFWNRRIFIVKLYKIQSVELYRGFYELRRGDIGSVIVHTAARSILIPFLRIDEAQKLINYLIYKVEADRRDWI